MDAPGTNGARPPGAGPENRSTADLLKAVARDTSTLVRKEVELARQELAEAVSARLRAVAAIATAGILGILALGFLGSAAAAALEGPLTPWGARLAVAGGYLLLAAAGVAFGRARMRRPPMKPEETIRTVKEDVEWVRAQLKR